MSRIAEFRCRWLAAALVLGLPGPAPQAMDWSPATHALAVGDFNGDRRDDLLVIARDPWRRSGIVLADTAGRPTQVQQTWRSDYLGIDWSGDRFVPIVGSFSSGKCTAGHMGTSCTYPDDLLLQGRDSAVHFVLFTDHQTATLADIQQQFVDPHLGLEWSAGHHRALAAHLDRDNYHDLFLQAVSPADQNHVVLSTTLTGFDDPGQPAQSWPNRWAGFDWSLADAVVHTGDFSGDGIEDLLVQGRTAPGEPYAPGQFGILAGQLQGGFAPADGSEPAPWLTWARTDFLVPDWSPEHYILHVGNFNNDRYDDVLLQPVAGGDAYIVFFGPKADAAGWAVARLVAGQQGLSWSADAVRLLAGDFNGDGRSQLYRVPVDGGAFNELVTVTGIQANGQAALLVASAPTPELDPAGSTGSPLPGTAVGATPGQFAVNDLGAAGYRIPLQMPPGARGMQPALALEYDSRLGNGLLGVGWRLSGLPEIERCAAIADPLLDGFSDGVDLDANDRYCLDGQRLVEIGAGGEYRTEIDSLQRVRAVGQTGSGPDAFTLEDGDGLTWTLGGSGAQVGAGSEVLIYLVKRVEDRYGNAIVYDWQQHAETFAYRPLAIRWSNAYGEVLGRLEFGYSPRADKGGGWRVGRRRAHPWRLTELRSYTRGAEGAGADVPVRAYHLGYAYSSVNNLSHLVQLTECELTAGSCLGATQFQLAPAERGFLAQGEATGINVQSLPALQSLDVNNNGIPDYVYLQALNDGRQAWHVRADGLAGPVLPHAAQANDWDRHVAFPVGYRAIALDYNGDGHADLAQASDDRDDAGTLIQLLAGSVDGLEVRNTSLHSQDLGFWASGVGADVNGDGLDDLVSAHGPWVEAFLSDGNDLGIRRIRGAVPGSLPDRSASGQVGSVLRPLNFNGDGRTDLLTQVADCELAPYVGYVCQSQQWVVYAWLDDAVERLDIVFRFPAGDYMQYPRLLDANGDGLTDLLFYHEQNERWELHVSDGQAFTLAWWGATVDLPQLADADYAVGQLAVGPRSLADAPRLTVTLDGNILSKARVLDYDRDGCDDLLLAIPGRPGLLALIGDSNGDFAAALVDTGIPAPTAADMQHLRVLDTGGDGPPDLLWPQPGGNYRLYHGRGPQRTLLTGVEDGLGNQTQIRYGLLTDPGVYLGRSNFARNADPVVFPYRHFAAAVYVVRESAVGDAADGSDGAVLTRYEYEGAKFHQQGRGFAGFSRLIARNVNRGIVTENRFAQRFPFQGMLVESMVRLPDDAAGAEMTTISLPGGSFTYPAICNVDISAPACQSFVNPGGSSAVPSPDERVISRSFSILAEIQTGQGQVGASHLPFVRQVTDLQYGLSAMDGAASGLQKRVRTTYDSAEYPVDQWANPSRILVETDSGDGLEVHRLTVHNTWDNRSDKWCPGLLTLSVTTQIAPGQPPATREESFSHDSNCALTLAVVQPSVPPARVERSFAYDDLGNRVEETVRAAAEGPRVAHWTYGPRYHGRFITRESNPAGHFVDIRWDGRFGLRTARSLAAVPGKLATGEWLFRYDNFGRLVSRRGPRTGMREEKLFQWCASAGCEATSAVTRVVTLAADGQEYGQEIDALGRVVHAHRLAFGAGRVHVDRRFDALGREYLTSRPYLDGQGLRCYRYREFDALNRIIFQQAPASEADCAGGPAPAPTVRPVAAGRQEIVTHDISSSAGIAVSRERRFPGDVLTPATITTVVRDLLDRQVLVAEAGGGEAASASYSWSASGNLAEILGSDGTLTELSYDSLGRLNVIRDPHLGQRVYLRNAFGEVQWEIDAEQQITYYEYDALSRLVRRTQRYNYADSSDPEQVITEWSFDTAEGAGIGRLAGAAGPYRLGAGTGGEGPSVRWEYDAFGQPQHEVHQLWDEGELHYLWLSRSYDDRGRPVELRYPSAVLDGGRDSPGSARYTLRYSYDGRGYLAAATDSDQHLHWQALAADVNGAYSEFSTQDDSVSVYRQRDLASGRLAGTSARRNSAWLQQQVYRWSGNGDLQFREDIARDVQSHFFYDGLGRLAGVQEIAGGATAGTASYAYDSAGNLLAIQGPGLELDYDPLRPQAVNQVRYQGTGLVLDYSYDANGNVIARGADVFEWTPSNQLAAVRNAAAETSLQYDHAGGIYREVQQAPGLFRRVLRAGPDFEVVLAAGRPPEARYRVRVGGELVAIVSQSADAPRQRTYLYRDAMGSIVGVDEPAGWQAIAYRSWGEPFDPEAAGAADELPEYLQAGGSRLGFTGHEHLADRGLLHLGGRVLDTVTGRFLSPDPVTQFPLSPHGLNRYAYALNRPATFIDPDGLSVGDWFRDLGERLFFGAPSFVLGGGVGGLLGLGVRESGSVALSLSVAGYRGLAGQGRAPVTATAGPGYTGVTGLGRPRGNALSLAGAASADRESTAALTNLRLQSGLRGLHHAAGAARSDRDGVGPLPDPVGEAANRVGRLLQPVADQGGMRRPGQIYLVGHPVNDVGPLHTAIEYRDEYGVFWISAGPEGLGLEGFRVLAGGVGNYMNGVRPTDVPANNATLGEIQPPPGISSREYFDRLRAGADAYCNCADYDLFPRFADGYNSNSYTIGLIRATGGSTTYDTTGLVGASKPLPPAYFGY